MNKDLTADIIIPTYKPGAEFQEELRRLALQSFKADKIIIINTDEQYWNKDAEGVIPGMIVRHISKKEFNHGHARNLGASLSDADVIVFMTQDAIPADKDLLKNLISPIADGSAAVSYARQLPKKDADEIEKYTRKHNYPDESRIKTKADLNELGIKTFFCSDVCAAYDHKLFDERGGFEEPVDFNEDMIYAAHAIEDGYAVAYTADARVLHSHNYTGRQQFERNKDIGISQKQHPEIFEKYPSEGAGISLVKSTAAHLIKSGHAASVPKLIWLSGMKYLGYLHGKKFIKQEKHHV